MRRQEAKRTISCTRVCPLLTQSGPNVLATPVSPPTERPVHSVTNQYRDFRVRQHLVCHTAEQNPG